MAIAESRPTRPSNAVSGQQADMAPHPNAHIENYLSYFLALPYSPRYAVLIDGPWGIGKTYFIRHFLQSHFPSQSDYVYISLYGLGDARQIDDALICAMYPLLKSKPSQTAQRIANAGLRYFKIDFELKYSDLINVINPKVYAFDDLERCELSAKDLWGYINGLVDRGNSRVILIINGEKVGDIVEYQAHREKVVGKVLQFTPVIECALTMFTTNIGSDETKHFVANHQNDIILLYILSGLHNLRIVQRALWEFERIYTVLDGKYKENDAPMNALLHLLFIFSFEPHASRINADDIANRKERSMYEFLENRDQREDGPFRTLTSRYKHFAIDNPILEDSILFDVLVRALVDPDAIERSWRRAITTYRGKMRLLGERSGTALFDPTRSLKRRCPC